MKDKYELFTIFMSFCNETKSQFEKITQVFRSDNGKKYFYVQLSSLPLQGILHQFTCPQASKQNGIA